MHATIPGPTPADPPTPPMPPEVPPQREPSPLTPPPASPTPIDVPPDPVGDPVEKPVEGAELIDDPLGVADAGVLHHFERLMLDLQLESARAGGGQFPR
jgi:hypothetical protein